MIDIQKDEWGCFYVHGSYYWGNPGKFSTDRNADKVFDALHQLIDEIKERAKLLRGPETLEINFESTILATKPDVTDMEFEPFDE
jgi:hypothetical protein